MNQGIKNGAPTDQSLGTNAEVTATRILSQNAPRIIVIGVGIFAIDLGWTNWEVGENAILAAVYGGALIAFALLGEVR